MWVDFTADSVRAQNQTVAPSARLGRFAGCELELFSGLGLVGLGMGALTMLLRLLGRCLWCLVVDVSMGT